MKINLITNSLFTSITYILHPCQNKPNVWLIDCGDGEKVFDFLRTEKIAVEGILLTHGHFDHMYGAQEILEAYPSSFLYTNIAGAEMLGNSRKNMSHYWGEPVEMSLKERIVTVEDGESVELGDGVTARAVFTPGHNPSCITWVVKDMVFSGDSLIPGIKTVTNLPGGNKALAKESEKLILSLAEGKRIMPGHKVDDSQSL